MKVFKMPEGGWPDSNLWFSIEFDKPLNGNQRHKYEDFCSGFLTYYDYIIKKNEVDHKLYFDWDNKIKIVRVYIDPAPKKYEVEIEEPESTTYELTAAATVSDPPTPPAPPPPSDIGVGTQL